MSNVDSNTWLAHHGIKGQKWGVRNGPPYPLDSHPSNRLASSKVTVTKNTKVSTDSSDKLGSSKISTKRSPKVPTGYDENLGIRKNTDKSIEESCSKINNRNIYRISALTNCPSCTTAYEMRRRGYDTVATIKMHPMPPERILKALGCTNDDLHSYPPGLNPFRIAENKKEKAKANSDLMKAYQDASKRSFEEHFNLLRDSVRDMDANTHDGERGCVTVFYADGGGHIFNWEKQDNELCFVDGQANEVLHGADSIIKNHAFVAAMAYARLDDKEFDSRAINSNHLIKETLKPNIGYDKQNKANKSHGRDVSDYNKQMNDTNRNQREEELKKGGISMSISYDNGVYLIHHGIKGQRWGVRHGPPYPIEGNRPRSHKVDNGTYKKNSTDNKLAGRKMNGPIRDAIEARKGKETEKKSVKTAADQPSFLNPSGKRVEDMTVQEMNDYLNRLRYTNQIREEERKRDEALNPKVKSRAEMIREGIDNGIKNGVQQAMQTTISTALNTTIKTTTETITNLVKAYKTGAEEDEDKTENQKSK